MFILRNPNQYLAITGHFAGSVVQLDGGKAGMQTFELGSPCEELFLLDASNIALEML